ncbi:MAG: helix-turn-helix transcriptional regulator [Bacilli bacterium]|nr:helix-turn-helix transcriptional regulator [Bacilli bacterium]
MDNDEELKDKDIKKDKKALNEEIDPKKVGDFLRELRKAKGMTQKDVANDLFITRQAISLWELGNCMPDYDVVLQISNYYGITISEFYAGRYLNSKEESNSIINKLIKGISKKYGRLLNIFIITIILLIVIFLGYYFLNNYRKIQVYMINNDEENYNIAGIITKSVNDIYLNIEVNKTVNDFCLVYKEDNIVCKGETNYIILSETLGYSEKIPNISFDDFISNLYVNIDNETKIKLNINKEYQNDKLFFFKDKNIAVNDEQFSLESNEEDIPKKIKENFEYDKDNNMYYLSYKEDDKKISITYVIDTHIFNVQEINDSRIFVWVYNIQTKMLNSYTETNLKTKLREKRIVDFSLVDSNEEIEKIIGYFSKKYLEKYGL